MTIKELPMREPSFQQTPSGDWYFTFEENHKAKLEDGPFDSYDECEVAGYLFLNTIHDKHPLRSDYIPGMLDYLVVYSGDSA